MPEPAYQRESPFSEWSTRTAITFLSPKRIAGVRSQVKELYPYGRWPTFRPLHHTVLWFMTPSKRMLIDFSLASSPMLNDLRYQAIPQGRNAVQLASLGLNEPSTLQSWGRSSVRQAASSNPGSCALASSPRKNFQPSVKSMSHPMPFDTACGARAGVAASDREETTAPIKIDVAKAEQIIRRSADVPFMERPLSTCAGVVENAIPAVYRLASISSISERRFVVPPSGGNCGGAAPA